MNVIHLLPDTVANQIAAGEVIQRPASVIKELMENSIDAGATDVRVSVQDAGRTQIQVADDGCGMNETDARLAFERHATSKIQTAQDLYNLNTMGFRGEALASIAAVAQVELLTRQEGEDLGIKLELSGADVVSQEPCATPKGSRFCVKNLFFNVPARRRFLKSDTAEMRHVCAEFLRVALAHPNVGVSLTSNGSTLYNLPAGNVRQRVAGVAGMTMAKHLLPVESNTSIVRISGFIGTPDTAKKTGGDQYFFANDRYMRSAYFNKAVTDAYKGIIPADHIPAYYLYLTVDPQALDVNVHPQKTEIKFDNDQAIWKILNAAVASSLNDNNILPQIDFDSGERIDIPRFDPTASQTTDGYNPFVNECEQAAQYAGSFSNRPSQSDIRGWETIYSSTSGGTSAPSGSAVFRSGANSETGDDSALDGSQAQWAEIQSRAWAAPQPLFETSDLSASTPRPELTQYKRRYIMCAAADGLLVIDQHRAHERVLYDSMKAMIGRSAVESQRLLFADTIAMGAEDLCIISELASELDTVGIEAEVDTDEGCVRISAIPAIMDIQSVRELIESLTADCRNGEVDIHSDVADIMARRLASRRAMPYGQTLTQAEMTDLYDRLMASPERQATPGGHAIIKLIRDADIDSLFN